MAETEKTVMATDEVVKEQTAPDAPKKNAVAAEPSHIAKMNNAEDLGAAVVKPTDSNPDATKQTKPVSGDAQQKSQGAADPMPTLDNKMPGKAMEAKETKDSEDKEIKEGELPAGLKKYMAKKDEKSEDYHDKDKKKEMKSEAMHDSEKKKEDEKKEEKEKEIDVKEHVDALVANEKDLSEEFKDKAATIFESAIKMKVKEIAEEMEADYKQKFEEDTAKAKDELVEKVDSYLSYVVEEWMKENEIALDRGIKGEIAEDFISGLKKLFEDHYIDVPDEKYNVLEDQASKIEDLEKKLNEEVAKNVDLNKANSSHERQSVLDEASDDLTDTAKEKFSKLAEEIEYTSKEDFTKKVDTIKESYFGKKAASGEIDDVAANEEGSNPDLSNAMAAYSAAISKTKDIPLKVSK